MALPVDIIQIIKDLQRRVFNLEATPQPPNINLDSGVSATFSAAAGDLIQIIVTLSNPGNARLLGMANWSIYRDSVSADNLWPYGANWTANPVEAAEFRVTTWNDWAETDNNNIKTKLFIYNNTGVAFSTLLFRANFRYLEREASSA